MPSTMKQRGSQELIRPMIMISNDDQNHVKVASAVKKGMVPWVPEPLGLAKLLQRK